MHTQTIETILNSYGNESMIILNFPFHFHLFTLNCDLWFIFEYWIYECLIMNTWFGSVSNKFKAFMEYKLKWKLVWVNSFTWAKKTPIFKLAWRMRREIGFKDSSIDLNMINSNGQRFFFPRKKGFVWHLSDCWNAANSCLIEMIEMWNNVLHSSTKSSDKEKRSPLICQEVCPLFHANLNDNRLKNRSHVFKVTSSYFMDPKLLLISAEHKKKSPIWGSIRFWNSDTQFRYPSGKKKRRTRDE